jgi:hypothetical protein
VEVVLVLLVNNGWNIRSRPADLEGDTFISGNNWDINSLSVGELSKLFDIGIDSW